MFYVREQRFILFLLIYINGAHVATFAKHSLSGEGACTIMLTFY